MNFIRIINLLFFIIFCVELSYSQNMKFEIDGPIKIGDYQGVNPDPGTIRWNTLANDFEGWDGISWKSLTTNAAVNSSPPEDDRRLGNERWTHGPLWSIDGNTNTFAYVSPPRLGTTDNAPLVFITNNIERLRINADGTIKMDGSLDVGEDAIIGMDLEVKQDVNLNIAGGSTTINGATTIGGADMNMATFTGPVQMNKTLDVDGNTTFNGISILGGTGMNMTTFTGPVQMNKTQNVDGAVTLNKSLLVSGPTSLSSSLTVKTLTVDSASTLKNTLDVDGRTTLNSSLAVNGITDINDSLTVTGMNSTRLTGKLFVNKMTKISDATSSIGTNNGALVVVGGVGIGENLNVFGTSKFNNKMFVTKDVSDIEKSFLTGQIVPNDGYVAVFNNTNNGFGDGIKIKLGRSRTTFAPDLANLPADIQAGILGTANAASEQIKNLLKCDYTGDKLALLQNVVLTGGLEDAKLAAGVALGLTNSLIDIINNKLSLPFNLATPINNGLDLATNTINLGINQFVLSPIEISFNSIMTTGIENPVNTVIGGLNGLDLADPINTILPINLGPINVGPVTVPALDVLIDFLPGDDFRIPVTGAIQIFPVTTVFPLTTLVPTIPSIKPFNLPTLNIPDLSIPDLAINIPDLPPIFIPAIPQIDASCSNTLYPALPPLTSIDVSSLEFWDIPNICLDEGGDVSMFLNSQNEFITFTDKDDKKMGSIKAWSLTDWSNKFLNPIFLAGMREAITESKVDKLHGQYHFRIERTKALMAYANIGVEYRSGNGDYAEWLERIDPKELVSAGDIVGVIGGRITKDLSNAEQVMAVSHFPIVLGNIPEEEKNHLGNNVAFMGQIPIKILGPVNSGDYIIGNNETPGYGYAKNPNDMSIDDFKLAVGRSWENDSSTGVKMINTVVGLHNGDYIKILKRYEEKFKESEARFESLESKVDALVQKINLNP